MHTVAATKKLWACQRRQKRLQYDIAHWSDDENFNKELMLDLVAILPVIGSIKYVKYASNVGDITKHADDIVDEARNIIKNSDEAGNALKGAVNATDALKQMSKTQKAIEIAKKSGKVADDFNLRNVYRHTFSEAHKADGLLKLGKNEDDILSNFIDLATSNSNRWIEGSNNIRTIINGERVTVTLFVRNGKMLNLDGFVGFSNRAVDNLIDLT